MEGVRKGLVIPASEALEGSTLSMMEYSQLGLKGPACYQKCIRAGVWRIHVGIRASLAVELGANLSIFCPCIETLQEAEIKGSRKAKEILRQPNI